MIIIYLDTSALVKAYFAETFSQDILALIKDARVAACHMLGYVEAHATFARLKRESKLSEKEYECVKKSFVNDWENYLRLGSDQKLIEHAADLAEAFTLRAYDSVHLAAADRLAKQTSHTISFACFDRQLNKAAKVLGLTIPFSF